MKRIIIKNSIAGDVKVLLKNGHYKPVKKLNKTDILINLQGKQTRIKNIIYKGNNSVISVYNEAWNNITKISKDQMFLTDINNNNNIALPSKIIWDIPSIGIKSKTLSYSFGYSIGILLHSSFITEDKLILFLKKEKLSEINYNLAITFGVQNIECYEGEYLIKYIFEKSIIPHYIIETISTKNINESIYKYNDEYLRGLFNGFKSALSNCENVTGKSINFLSEFFNWLNIAVPKENNKLNIRFFIEDEGESDDLWEIHTEDPLSSFIGNNLIFIH